ncbi:MAG: tRNA dihydrouridine synthase DusB [Elusimicrobia bacterium]|nr:tRNA dihydrouridine synthase DusB [Elusimicrobiota bacterium]
MEIIPQNVQGPVSIGPVRLKNPFGLAPMAGIGDPPYRRLCARNGAGLVCTEMVSANALHYGDEKSKRMMKVYPDEHPVSLQLFGAEPSRLAAAARLAEDAGADIVDLNAGCPVPKITKTGAGVSLMRNEDLFARCLEAMVRAVKIPVTVKMRLGTVDGENGAVRLARLAEAAGVKAVTVHARFQGARHGGPPDLDALSQVVSAVKVPVLGNGGVRTHDDARKMKDASGCAAILIGRAAVGNPFFFAELNGGAVIQLSRRFEILREHIHLIVEYYGEKMGVIRLRKFLSSYTAGLPHAAEFRSKAYTLVDSSELLAYLNNYEMNLSS